MDRYNQESASSSLTIDAPESSPLLNLFHPNNVLNPSSNYGQDPNSFYSSSGSIFAPDGRLRLTSKYVTPVIQGSTFPKRGVVGKCCETDIISIVTHRPPAWAMFNSTAIAQQLYRSLVRRSPLETNFLHRSRPTEEFPINTVAGLRLFQEPTQEGRS